MEKFFHLPRLAGRLDLAAEANSLLRGAANVEIEGVSEEVEQLAAVRLHTITILNGQGSRALGRPPGRYLTLELPPLEDGAAISGAVRALAEALGRLLPPLGGRTLLVAGLGNRAAIPDALGPRVAELTYATRHIFTPHSQPEGLERVCSLAPGVTSSSGLATAELIQGVCDRLRPAALIVVDSLAAASITRVGVTIQLTDSGIVPGSGVGGGNGQLCAASVGCPLVAVGVPTVVDTAAIISETLAALGRCWRSRAMILPPELDDQAREYAERELLNVFHGQLMVTPKDIDRLIADQAEIIAAAIAVNAHPACTAENYHDYIR